MSSKHNEFMGQAHHHPDEGTTNHDSYDNSAKKVTQGRGLGFSKRRDNNKSTDTLPKVHQAKP